LILTNFGELIAKLHNADIIHGDLTTSNILIKTEEKAEIEASQFV